MLNARGRFDSEPNPATRRPLDTARTSPLVYNLQCEGKMNEWMEGLDAAITVADRGYEITYMNPKAIATLEKYGGEKLLGKSLLDCHNERSKAIIKKIMETGEPHTYTIQKGGIKKMIHQTPWKKDGKIEGVVEISIEIPWEMEHFNRD
jgi:transcriptional regulator with PAS, ATPase and Fis domain